MVLFKFVFAFVLLVNSGFVSTVHAENENTESETNKTETIVGDNDVREENHSNYEVPSSEDLEGISQMEVVSNVNENGQSFNHEDLVGTKQFLTVVTPDGRTYYIVITYEQIGTKVHLLKDMSEVDVESVANAQPQAGQMTQAQADLAMEQNANSVENENNEKLKVSSSMKTNLIVFAVVALGVGAFGYFKLKKDKSAGSSDSY